VLPPEGFHEFLCGKQVDGLKALRKRGIILWEDETGRTLRKALEYFRQAGEILLLVGPEGGFSKEEVDRAVDRGFITVSLGPRVLRTETAPLSALSIIQYEMGDMG
jgi:16S rRNA (uracil1498-N3)-methyltransferase